MQVAVIEYERLKSLGQWENHRVKVVLELEATDDPERAIDYAKEFVGRHLESVPAAAPPPWDSYPWAGSVCPACGEHQRMTPSGPLCRNGHGGS